MIEIRTCTPEESAEVCALLGELGYTLSLRQVTDNVRELGKTGADQIFLAIVDRRLVGLLASHLCRMLQYASPVVRVTALVVHPRARRRGVGRLLMEHAEQIGSAARCEFVELTLGHGPHRGACLLSQHRLRAEFAPFSQAAGPLAMVVQYLRIAAERPGGGKASRSTRITEPP
jgi:GNAT superfamily N-acetyltransferase